MAAVEVEEIIEEIEVLVETTAEELEVTIEVLPEAENVIEIGETFEEAMQSINMDFFEGFLTSDVELESTVMSEVEVASDEIISFVEESTSAIEEIGSEAGSLVSRGTAEQQAGADAVQQTRGCWYYVKKIGGFTKKFLEACILVDFCGKMISDIVSAINDSSKNPKWKGSLTEKEKDKLVKLNDASGTLRSLFEGWKKGCDELDKAGMFSYGSMSITVGGRKKTVQVIDVCAYILLDSLRQLDCTNKILKKGIEELTVFDLNQLTNYVFGCFANAQALIDLRNNKGNLVKDDMLATVKFPSPNDDKTVQKALITDFPGWKDGVNSQGFNLAKIGASMATSAFAKSQAAMKIQEYLRKNVYPVIKSVGKEAGKKAAQDYVNSEKATLIAKALIPVVGPELAREYGKEVQQKAIKTAQEAAQTAGSRKAHEIKGHLKNDLKPVLQDIMDGNEETMKRIGEYAVKQILNTIAPAGSGGKQVSKTNVAKK